MRRLAVLAVSSLLWPASADAHPVGLSRSELQISGRTIAARLRGSVREFGLVAQGGAPTAAQRDGAMAATLGQVIVRLGEVRCAFIPGALAWEPPDGFLV